MENSIQEPLVSVIVPCYNCSAFLKETLDSVINQTFQSWECIIVDNASTDDSKKIAEDYAEKDKRFISISQVIKGVSSARNKGIANSKGMYILPLDADDKIASSYIEQAVKVFENNPGIKIVYCEAALFGHISGKWNLPEYSMSQMLKQNLIFCSGLYRRSDYDQTKGYNQSFLQGFEDWDFWLSLLKRGGDVYRINEILFFYRIRKSSRNNSLDLEKQKNLRRLVYENHKELYTQLLNVSDLVFENYLTETKYNAVVQSPDYKIGKFLLGPLRMIKSLFQNKA